MQWASMSLSFARTYLVSRLNARKPGCWHSVGHACEDAMPAAPSDPCHGHCGAANSPVSVRYQRVLWWHYQKQKERNGDDMDEDVLAPVNFDHDAIDVDQPDTTTR